MNADRNEVHSETDAARAGSTPHIVRWILVISLLAAIVLLSIIWITGAATQSDAESSQTQKVEVQESRATAEQSGDQTDSIVHEGFDEIEAAEPGDRPPSAPPVVEN